MPDVDVDFDERRRGDVIRYVTEKYGDDRVAQIITYGTIKAKAAIKDASRVLGFPYALGDRITKVFPPPILGKDMPLSGVFEPDHPRYGEASEIRALYEGEAEVKQVLDAARGLEGLIRQAGVHAAGVIMSCEPLLDHIPVWKREADGAVITQFDYPSCEDIGLLKMDFLGLRNLTVIDDAIRGIKDNRGIEIDLETLGLDDKPTYELLARGDTLGVFQLDGGPMRGCCGPCGPTSSATSPRSSRCTGRARWPAPPSTPTARPAGRRWCRSTRSSPSRSRTSSARATASGLPGRRHVRRAEAGRVLARQGRPAAAGHGQEEEGDPGEGVRAVRGRHEGQRLLRRRDQDHLGRDGPVLRLRLQQGARGRVRADLLLDRLPEGQLPGRVHGRACSPPSLATRTSPRCT